jgi:hypothetical protein
VDFVERSEFQSGECQVRLLIFILSAILKTSKFRSLRIDLKAAN